MNFPWEKSQWDNTVVKKETVLCKPFFCRKCTVRRKADVEMKNTEEG